MIIIGMAGGLGNQMQQYALYKKFVKMGKEAKLDVSWFSEESASAGVTFRNLELNYLEGINYATSTEKERDRLIGSRGLTGKIRRKIFPGTVRWFHESKMYHPEILNYTEMYLSGYFACEKYYADILEELREEIRFPVSDNLQNMKMKEELQKRESVSVHVRRGDYLNTENMEIFGNICTEAYYRSAISLIRQYCTSPHFYVFSDDINYARQNFGGEDYTIIDINHGKDSFYDMWLMSNCRHNICANSTFSFWGARLNKNAAKIMIRPTIHKNTQVFCKEEMEDLWKGWRFVSPLGEVE